MVILVEQTSCHTSHPGPNLGETARSSRLVERRTELVHLDFGVGRSFCIIDCKLQTILEALAKTTVILAVY